MFIHLSASAYSVGTRSQAPVVLGPGKKAEVPTHMNLPFAHRRKRADFIICWGWGELDGGRTGEVG